MELDRGGLVAVFGNLAISRRMFAEGWCLEMDEGGMKREMRNNLES